MENTCNNCRFVEEMLLAPKDLICMNPESENYLGVVNGCKCELFLEKIWIIKLGGYEKDR
jgi:hypothetical protein